MMFEIPRPILEEDIEKYIDDHSNVVMAMMGLAGRVQRLSAGDSTMCGLSKEPAPKGSMTYSAPWFKLDCDSLIRLFILIGEFNLARVKVHSVDITKAGAGYKVRAVFDVTPLNQIGVDKLSDGLREGFDKYNQLWNSGKPVTTVVELPVCPHDAKVFGTHELEIENDTFCPKLFLDTQQVMAELKPSNEFTLIPTKFTMLAGNGFVRLNTTVVVVMAD